METTQQIILIILSFCVWIIGGLGVLTLLGGIMYLLVYIFCKSFGNMNKQFLSYLYWKYYDKNFGIQKEYFTFLKHEKEIKEYLKTLKRQENDDTN